MNERSNECVSRLQEPNWTSDLCAPKGLKLWPCANLITMQRLLMQPRILVTVALILHNSHTQPRCPAHVDVV